MFTVAALVVAAVIQFNRSADIPYDLNSMAEGSIFIHFPASPQYLTAILTKICSVIRAVEDPMCKRSVPDSCDNLLYRIM